MALSCEMDNAVDLLVLHQLVEGVKVADVHLHKLVVGFVLDVLEICEIARIRQFVEVNNVILGILVHKQAHHVASNKACASSNYDCLHIFTIYIFTIYDFVSRA